MARKPAEKPEAGGRPEAAGPGEAESGFDFKAHKVRGDRAWTLRMQWNSLYDEAYEYAIPYRRPQAKTGAAASRIDRLFDNTAIVSTFRFAGQLQTDLFPPGHPFFKLAPGPAASVLLEEVDEVELSRELEKISKILQSLFLTSEFDTAIHETCVDLSVGTGALLPVAGDGDRPVRFVNVPSDEVAIESGPYNDIAGIFWRTMWSWRQIRAAFPNGRFDAAFREAEAKNPDEYVELRQDFVRDGKRWRMVVSTGSCEVPIVNVHHRTQQMVVARYYRVPGEAYGRGPVLLALPTVKTLNKAMELTLKSAAIEMLGIWGYRPGGAFNPDTARIAPGAWWPMQATGGVLGADVTRMDVSAGKIDVANLMTNELRTQVQAALHDTQLGPEQGTPKSATEIMARMKRISENYMGAFGRLVHEIVPVLVRRVIEIAYDAQLIDKAVPIDDLLVRVDVLSPIAAALKANALSTIVEFIQLVATLRGPQAVDLVVKVDAALSKIGSAMGVPAELLLTKQEQEQLKATIAAAAQAAMQAQADAAAPPAEEPAPSGGPLLEAV